MSRALAAFALVWTLWQAPPSSPLSFAPGSPGEQATWTNGNKQGVGTAFSPLAVRPDQRREPKASGGRRRGWRGPQRGSRVGVLWGPAAK